MVDVQNVSVQFGQHEVLRDMTLQRTSRSDPGDHRRKWLRQDRAVEDDHRSDTPDAAAR